MKYRADSTKENIKNNTSRVPVLALALGLALTIALPVQAEQQVDQYKEWTTEKSSLVAGASVAGAIIAGPVGFVLGVAAGDWLGDSVNMADSVDELVLERDQVLAELARAQGQLMVARSEADRYQDLALDSLQLNVMFSTAADSINPRVRTRLDALVRLLSEKPQLRVQLAGFADPRGADVYNMELSERRAASVRSYLISQGVEAGRIQSMAYGARHSEAQKNDLDAYAMERVVTIELQENNEDLAVSK